jgi:hypothetical protein
VRAVDPFIPAGGLEQQMAGMGLAVLGGVVPRRLPESPPTTGQPPPVARNGFSEWRDWDSRLPRAEEPAASHPPVLDNNVS